MIVVDPEFMLRLKRIRTKRLPLVNPGNIICPPVFHGSFQCVGAVMKIYLETFDSSLLFF
jgi:hypothetical protein